MSAQELFRLMYKGQSLNTDERIVGLNAKFNISDEQCGNDCDCGDSDCNECSDCG